MSEHSESDGIKNNVIENQENVLVSKTMASICTSSEWLSFIRIDIKFNAY